MGAKQTRAFLTGLGFLLPNVLGFMCFTLLPLIISMGMAFTNWDLRLHNMFKSESIHFIGFQNFRQLFSHPDFWQYFGNTLFLMIGIPFSITASLCAALLLSKKFKSGRAALPGLAVAGVLLLLSCGLLLLTGTASVGGVMLLGSLVGFMLVGGALGGSTFYRTIYYLPNFTAGVAVFLLWKKMYDPVSGPVNAALQPVLNRLSSAAAGLSPGAPGLLQKGLIAAGLALIVWTILRAGLAWLEERTTYWPHRWDKWKAAGWRLVLGGLASWLLISLGRIAPHGIEVAAAGLTAPNWLTNYIWAKPAIMIMGLWVSAGSTNMLLYLAGLSNIPMELYEAADMDGASSTQRFWNVTWPQLAPITFFIFIMSTMGGLQGGFEMARTMTNGGPGGATTTLSYFVYSEGFETGRLGYASAIAWSLFLFVLVVTLVNWRFGSRMTND